MTRKLSVTSALDSHSSNVYHQDKCANREYEMLARNMLVSDYRYSAVQYPLAREVALLCSFSDHEVVDFVKWIFGLMSDQI